MIRDFKQITTTAATIASVTEKFRGEYALVVCQISEILSLAKWNTKLKEPWAKELKISFI